MRSDMDHTVLRANYTMPAFAPSRQNITALWLVLIYGPTEGRRLSRPGWLVTYRNKVPPPGVEPGHVTHPSTDRARRRVTSLIRPTPLPLRHVEHVSMSYLQTQRLTMHKLSVFVLTYAQTIAAESAENDADHNRPAIDYYSYHPRQIDIGTEGMCLQRVDFVRNKTLAMSQP